MAESEASPKAAFSWKHVVWIAALWAYLGVASAITVYGMWIFADALSTPSGALAWIDRGGSIAAASAFLLAPWLERFRPRRRGILPTAAVLMLLGAAVCGASWLPHAAPLSFVLMGLVGLAASILGILADGQYIELFSRRQRAWLLFLRSVAGAMGMQLGTVLALSLPRLSGLPWGDPSYGRVALLGWFLFLSGFGIAALAFTPKTVPQRPPLVSARDALRELRNPSLFPLFGALAALGIATPLYSQVQAFHLLAKVEDGGLGLSNEALGTLQAVVRLSGMALGSLAAVLAFARSESSTLTRLIGLIATVPAITLLVEVFAAPEALGAGALMALAGAAWGWIQFAAIIVAMDRAAQSAYPLTVFAFAVACWSLPSRALNLLPVKEALALGYLPAALVALALAIPAAIAFARLPDARGNAPWGAT